MNIEYGLRCFHELMKRMAAVGEGWFLDDGKYFVCKVYNVISSPIEIVIDRFWIFTQIYIFTFIIDEVELK